ncbi:GNAT family N-acetyltransferase [Lentzea sp. NBRC 102530]|uniref:GNAT family N-acetyltransferase n=1 Tax=Lentzea sp. NBRC 102530 TaxID=3032201 RepID=UPI002556D470|nr:GNAT family N-acetyltransferase [Lentzea sp. NBRC 102530]
MRSILGEAVTVRPAVVTDAPAVAHVHVQAWKDAYRGLVPDEVLDGRSIERSTEMWERDIPHGGVWVGLAGDEVVGFACVGPSREPDAEHELYAIYVLASAYDTGLGFALASAALEGKTDVGLWVFEDNPRARRFYERFGFRTDGLVKTETIGGVALAEMRYRLTAD